MDPDFEELSNDTNIIARLKQFTKATNDIDKMTQLIANPDVYQNLTNADKIKYNLLLSFNLNSLYWMYLRAEGVDPVSHQIKGENDRLKQAMAKAQAIKDKKTMPRIDKNAAKRFVRNSLWTPNNEESANNTEEQDEQWDMVIANENTESPATEGQNVQKDITM